jgi:hypothetical protein
MNLNKGRLMDTNRQHNPKPIPPHARRHLVALQKSGKTIAAYCRAAGVSPWSIYDWKKRYGKKVPVSSVAAAIASGPDLQPVRFTELGTLPHPNRSTPRFEIRLACGTSIGVYEGATVEEIAPFLLFLNGRAIVC